jgi:hypothetical protein
MERQLVLIEEGPDWRLDEVTRAVGREGIAVARARLREARRAAAGARAGASAVASPPAPARPSAA